MAIEKLCNKFPDSVEGDSSAGPIEMAAKINEVIEVVNELNNMHCDRISVGDDLDKTIEELEDDNN